MNLLLLGQIGKAVESKPSVLVTCPEKSIAKKIVAFLKRHGSLKELGFEFYAYRERTFFCTNETGHIQMQETNLETASLCGKPIITSTVPIAETS